MLLRQHLIRFILIGLYTGTRHEAILNLQWEANEKGGHIDLDQGVIYRRSATQDETSKRRPPIRIPDRLLPHLKRWKALDKGLTHVVHFRGKPILRIVKTFRAAREEAGLNPRIVPHTLRHTCITWLMQNGVPLNEVAGFAGVHVKVLEKVYSHHHPDHQVNVVSKRMIGKKPVRHTQSMSLVRQAA